MSFCLRGIASNGGRYVVQGCGAARRFSNRQLPAHVNETRSSATAAVVVNTDSSTAVLNEFLGSNTTSLRIKNKCHKTVHKPHRPTSPAEVDELLLHAQASYDVIEHDTHPTSRFRESHRLLTKQEEGWLHLSQRINSDSLGVLFTKDNAKDIGLRYSALPKTATNATASDENITNSSSANNDPNKKDDSDLIYVYDTLTVDIPRLFTKSLNYKIYHPDVEFVNNIRGTATKGIYPYVKQMAWLKTVGHFKFAYVKMEVLKITMHTQDNTVKIRWRINGITGMKVLKNLWKFKFWKIRESLHEAETWLDGFSTFYVGNDGRIYKHVAEKMMPDEDLEEVKPKSGIQSKLASQLTFSSIK